jgi:hypothetical protein
MLLKYYLLIVAIYAACYYFTESLSPPCGIASATYFSFVTMATVGFGDIAPIGFGRVLVCAQIVTSVLFHVAAISCFASVVVGLHGMIMPMEEVEDAKRRLWKSQASKAERRRNGDSGEQEAANKEIQPTK